MNELKLHETTGKTTVFDSLQDALCAHVPSPQNIVDHLRYLAAMHTVLVRTLSVEHDASNVYCGRPHSQGWRDARRVFAALRAQMINECGQMARLDESYKVNGYNRLMLVFIVYSQVSVFLWRVDGVRDDDDDIVYNVNRWMTRTAMHAVHGGYESIGRYSMRELRRAWTLLTWRMRVISSLNVDYVDALERRTCAFVVNEPRDVGDYDVPAWVDASEKTASTRTFVATMVWYVVVVRTAVNLHDVMARDVAYVPDNQTVTFVNAHENVVTAEKWTIDCHNMERMLGVLGRDATGVDRLRTFRKEVYDAYSVAPGEIAMHTRVFGLGGSERAMPVEVIDRTRMPEATTWIGRKRFKRPLVDWTLAALRRPVVRDDIDNVYDDVVVTGGSIGNEEAIERMILFFLVHTKLSNNRFNIDFLNLVCILDYRVPMMAVLPRVQKAMHVGLPFIVQVLAKYHVVIPKKFSDDDDDDDESPSSSLIDVHERMAYAPAIVVPETCGAIVYRCYSVVEALVVWAEALLVGWDGRIEHSNQSLRPFLRQLLGRVDDTHELESPIGVFSHS